MTITHLNFGRTVLLRRFFKWHACLWNAVLMEQTTVLSIYVKYRSFLLSTISTVCSNQFLRGIHCLCTHNQYNLKLKYTSLLFFAIIMYTGPKLCRSSVLSGRQIWQRDRWLLSLNKADGMRWWCLRQSASASW